MPNGEIAAYQPWLIYKIKQMLFRSNIWQWAYIPFYRDMKWGGGWAEVGSGEIEIEMEIGTITWLNVWNFSIMKKLF